MTQHHERVHAATLTEIKQQARRLMATQGTAALSLKAIAEQMGFTSQALYRYFSSRDALITALIVDACTDLATTLAAARDAVPVNQDADRLFTMMWSYREWAIARPVDYALIYTKPVPDYRPEPALIEPALQRITTIMIGAMQSAWQRGLSTTLPEYDPLPDMLRQQIERTSPAAPDDVSAELLHTALVVWSQLHGLITLEIFGHLYPMLDDLGTMYHFEILTLLKRMGLHPSHNVLDAYEHKIRSTTANGKNVSGEPNDPFRRSDC